MHEHPEWAPPHAPEELRKQQTWVFEAHRPLPSLWGWAQPLGVSTQSVMDPPQLTVQVPGKAHTWAALHKLPPPHAVLMLRFPEQLKLE